MLTYPLRDINSPPPNPLLSLKGPLFFYPYTLRCLVMIGSAMLVYLSIRWPAAKSQSSCQKANLDIQNLYLVSSCFNWRILQQLSWRQRRESQCPIWIRGSFQQSQRTRKVWSWKTRREWLNQGNSNITVRLRGYMKTLTIVLKEFGCYLVDSEDLWKARDEDGRFR